MRIPPASTVPVRAGSSTCAITPRTRGRGTPVITETCRRASRSSVRGSGTPFSTAAVTWLKNCRSVMRAAHARARLRTLGSASADSRAPRKTVVRSDASKRDLPMPARRASAYANDVRVASCSGRGAGRRGTSPVSRRTEFDARVLHQCTCSPVVQSLEASNPAQSGLLREPARLHVVSAPLLGSRHNRIPGHRRIAGEPAVLNATLCRPSAGRHRRSKPPRQSLRSPPR